jgi:hypothetical protein
MLPFPVWFPLAVVGLTFTVFGCLKVYGAVRGIEGGHDKPIAQQLCGA